jgi:Leucine Rich repeats (2 copies)/Leucine Rich repeat
MKAAFYHSLSLCLFFTLSPPLTGQQKDIETIAVEAYPTFLEVASDPKANAIQKRTVSAMMKFVKETDPSAAWKKLQASNSFILYGGGDGSQELYDLSLISGLTAIDTLVFVEAGISDLKPMASLKNLRSLRLEKNSIEDLSPLANLQKLESLQIGDNHITDLRPISGLKKLKTLSCSNNKISDISPLKELKELNDLDVTGNIVADLTVIAELSIRTLRLNRNGITDVTALRQMNHQKQAVVLDLADNAIRDVTPLVAIPGIIQLDLANNRIEDVGAFANTEIRTLILQGNKLPRIPDFTKSKIGHIDLRRNPIKDYSNLIEFKKANARVEIRADEAFTRAFDKSIPVKKELEGSPLLGTWRTEPMDTEWGTMILELRFLSNGLVYQGMLSAEIPLLEQNDAFRFTGDYSVKDDQLEMTFLADTKKWHFEMETKMLTLKIDGEKVIYKKFEK